MIVVLVSMGLYLSIRFHFYYNFRHIGFHFCNTFGKMFQRHGSGQESVSGFAAACTAMANTIGVGNIGGVATAIVSGGPSAVFWMWVSGCLGMSTKACEIILGQRFRVKYSESMDEYMCDRSFVMRNAMGWWKGAFLLAIACFTLGPGRAVSRRNLSSALCGKPSASTRSGQPLFWDSPVSSPSSAACGAFRPLWNGSCPLWPCSISSAAWPSSSSICRRCRRRWS